MNHRFDIERFASVPAATDTHIIQSRDDPSRRISPLHDEQEWNAVRQCETLPGLNLGKAHDVGWILLPLNPAALNLCPCLDILSSEQGVIDPELDWQFDWNDPPSPGNGYSNSLLIKEI